MTQSADAFHPETLIAIDAVERALELARRGVGRADTTAKGGRDLVTATDLAVEDAVRGIVSHALGSLVVGEERGGEAPADGSPYWLVDPICGTRNFASGTPMYCVNLALVEGGRVTVAVVGDPSTGEIHVAERGRGARALKDGARRALTTSDESRTIVIEDGKSTGARREHAAQFTAAAIRADRWDFRSLGTTLALAYVAAGRISAYVRAARSGRARAATRRSSRGERSLACARRAAAAGLYRCGGPLAAGGASRAARHESS